MIQRPIDINTQFPVRKSKKQKKAFRDAVAEYARGFGYECSVEKGSFGARNVVIGDPKNAKYLITAHYDTCARLPFPNLITPCNFLLFILYQLLITAFLLAVPIAVGVTVYLFTKDPAIGSFAAYLCFLALALLMMAGPANRRNANDNTSGVVTVLEIARTLPENLRDKVCFVLFDLEEAGLIGSSAYRNAHKKQVKQQIVLNLDCVGEGDEILFFPTGKLKKDKARMELLEKGCGQFKEKSIRLRRKGFSVYPSDQSSFPFGVGIAAFNRSKWAGLYLGKIHTGKDTVLDETNVNLLRASLTTLVSMDTVK